MPADLDLTDLRRKAEAARAERNSSHTSATLAFHDAAKRIEPDAFLALISAAEERDRLRAELAEARAAVIALADAADVCAEKANIVQPFFGVWKEHGAVIERIRAARTSPPPDREKVEERVARLKRENAAAMRAGAVWKTDETPPRTLTVKGRSAIDPDVLVAELDGPASQDASAIWIVDDGIGKNCAFVCGLDGDVHASPVGASDG